MDLADLLGEAVPRAEVDLVLVEPELRKVP